MQDLLPPFGGTTDRKSSTDENQAAVSAKGLPEVPDLEAILDDDGVEVIDEDSDLSVTKLTDNVREGEVDLNTAWSPTFDRSDLSVCRKRGAVSSVYDAVDSIVGCGDSFQLEATSNSSSQFLQQSFCKVSIMRFSYWAC